MTRSKSKASKKAHTKAQKILAKHGSTLPSVDRRKRSANARVVQRQPKETPRKRSSFSLKWPKGSSSSVAWLKEPFVAAAAVKSEVSNTTTTSSLPTSGMAERLLNLLDRELLALAEYVRLWPAEQAARNRFIEHVQATAASIESNPTSVEVFGSYANRDVCMFASDVDLVWWGAVPVESTIEAQLAVKPPPPPREDDKLERKRKWLQAIDQANAMSPGGGDLLVIDRQGDSSVPPSVIDLSSSAPEHETDTKPAVAARPTRDDAADGESDVDSADKLQAWTPQRRPQQPDDQHRISLSSSSSDTEQEGDQEEENDNLEVNFVAPATPSRAGPTGRARIQCVDALGRLRRKLSRAKPCLATQSQLIKTARVPIIKIVTSWGFEADVALGGHNGTDTSNYAKTLLERFESFAPVVLFLKVLLAQHDLDKPFCGGLGSYKLYVLVAYHIQKHLELGGRDRPGEVLLSFLYRFGCALHSYSGTKTPPSTHTALSRFVPVKCRDGTVADLSNVFLLEHCVSLFRGCSNRLMQNLRGKCHEKKSLFVSIFDAHRLESERTRCWQQAKASSTAGAGTTKRKAASSKPAATAKPLSKQVIARFEYPREQTAAELVRGYQSPPPPPKRPRLDAALAARR